MTVAEMMDREVAENPTESVNDMLSMVSYNLGRMSAHVDAMHTCDSVLRYPWPPSQDCHACRFRIERFVEVEHLEMPYRLFGWDAIVHHFWEMLDRKAQQAEARRNMGAHI